MNYSTQHSTAQLPGALLGSALALAALPTLASASPLPQVVTTEIVTLAGPSSGIEDISMVSGDGEGSWVATAKPLGTQQGSTAFYGVLAGSGTTTPSILRTASTLSGYTQQTIFSPKVTGTRIAYTSFAPPAGPGFTSWIDDTLVAAEGVPIGTTGLEWFGSGTPMLTQGQAFYVRGIAQPVGGAGATRTVVVRYPAETVVLEVGQVVPGSGLSGPLTSILSFDPVSNGTSWAASVTYESSVTGQTESAVLRNGFVVALNAFERLNTETSSFEEFGRVFIDDSFDVMFETVDTNGAAIYRNGRAVVRGPLQQFRGIDRLRRAVTYEFQVLGLGLNYEGISLDRPGAAGVDANGDGNADPGWSLLGAPSFASDVAFLDDGRLLSVADVSGPGVGSVTALVAARLVLPDDVICEGEPNSTGRRASLRAIGSDVPALSDLQLRLTDAPGGAPVLPLVSRTMGFVANPAGSAGNLCLAGSIGRGIATNSFTGSTTYRVYPTALPQPNGFTAALSGETWYFQAWFRDVANGQSTSNFTGAVAVPFR